MEDRKRGVNLARSRKFNFDLRYAFFIVMGGVRIPLESLAKFVYPPADSKCFGVGPLMH